jgi:dTDP-4-dehydrorhamnose reductase
MRVVVMGCGGQLGAAVVQEFKGRRHDVVALDHADVDVTRRDAVAVEIPRHKPDLLINCTGYNAVDAAEDDPVAALEVNALGVRALAESARTIGAVFIHYGSDFVFDGEGRRPYTEDDRPRPKSVYAASKMLGDWFALDVPRAYVLRVESLFGRAVDGPPPKGSVEQIVQALRAGKPIKVFEDRTVTPTFVIDAARATRELSERQPEPGLYHCVNSGSCTWLELAREAARQLGVNGQFEPIRLADMKLKAQRPLYCAMSNAKLASAGITMPTWQDALSRYLSGSALQHS